MEMVATAKRQGERRREEPDRSRQIGDNRWWMEHERRGGYSLSLYGRSIHLGLQVAKLNCTVSQAHSK